MIGSKLVQSLRPAGYVFTMPKNDFRGICRETKDSFKTELAVCRHENKKLSLLWM